MPANDPLVRVCSLLNAEGAKYIVCGGQAVNLQGYIRTTEDVDILIEESEENCRKVLAGLAKMEDGWAAQLSPRDLLENVVVKIADEVEVDVSTRAWKISYADAIATACEVVIDGVRIPYLGLDCLIASKETYRDKDKADVAYLRSLKEKK